MKLSVRLLTRLDLEDRAVLTYAIQNWSSRTGELLPHATVRTQVFKVRKSENGGSIVGGDEMIVARDVPFFQLPKSIAEFDVDHSQFEAAMNLFEDMLVEEAFGR